MSTSRSRIEYLLRVSRSLLQKADGVVSVDTEFLRDELDDLRGRLEILLEKIQAEKTLEQLQEYLHGPEQEP